jgi:hypothetical protein
MVADRGYCDWLMAQPWFAEKFRDVYNVIVNYGAVPQDTPEHNALQARFLDDDFCMKLAMRVYPEGFSLDEQVRDAIRGAKEQAQANLFYAERILLKKEKEFEKYNSEWVGQEIEKIKSEISTIKNSEVLLKTTYNKVQEVLFEEAGWDAVISIIGGKNVSFVGYSSNISDENYYRVSEKLDRRIFWSFYLQNEMGKLYVEVKPSVGDDYPTILRQIDKYSSPYGRRVLLIGEFDARGATLEQVKKIFATKRIKIVMLSELENNSFSDCPF